MGDTMAGGEPSAETASEIAFSYGKPAFDRSESGASKTPATMLLIRAVRRPLSVGRPSST